jgi:hypothetical protein
MKDVIGSALTEASIGILLKRDRCTNEVRAVYSGREIRPMGP